LEWQPGERFGGTQCLQGFGFIIAHTLRTIVAPYFFVYKMLTFIGKNFSTAIPA
jgi:hypothetical protein